MLMIIAIQAQMISTLRYGLLFLFNNILRKHFALFLTETNVIYIHNCALILFKRERTHMGPYVFVINIKTSGELEILTYSL